MAGRTPREAIQNFVTPRQQALSCVTDTIVVVRSKDGEPEQALELTLNNGFPARLSGNGNIAITVSHRFRSVEDPATVGLWRITPIGYVYTLLDSEQREIIAYHWHPTERSGIMFPHLHLGPGAKFERFELWRAHLPTGQIAIEDVLRLAIRDFGVRPRRRNWATILDRTQSAYDE